MNTMQRDGFEQWLKTYESERSGGLLGPGAIRDALSRCKRVERRLGVDLDAEIRRGGDAAPFVGRVTASVKKLGIKGHQERGLASIVRAVRLYGAYRGAK